MAELCPLINEIPNDQSSRTVMNDREHRTDTVCVYKPVTIGPQKKHWVEFQLLDEMGDPLANLPWRAINDAVREGCVPEYSGLTDAQGVIRLEGLYPLDMTLLMAADPLAEVLQQRRLRTERAEPEHPVPGDPTPVYGPMRSGFSPVEQRANADGHVWHYLRIGQLCDRLPNFEPKLDDPKAPPPYHFPDTTYSGFTARYEQLNRRHVLEVCPLRAWSLILHHQKEYSLTNAYNLALMSNLAYSKVNGLMHGSIKYFFDRQCLDMSRTPRVWDGGPNWPCVVKDVPFDDRYTVGELLNTADAKKPKGDTQLLYAVSFEQVLVAWRGTEMNRYRDLFTDLAIRPVKSESLESCQPIVPCPDLTAEGRVHFGFLESFNLAHELFVSELRVLVPNLARGRDLFICGHSLGGALGLLHAAKLRDSNPLLYTYGMPRTFTHKAVSGLSDIPHFRHINDTDTIPNVPPEANIDNHLYKVYGYLGTALGFAWSAGQAMTSGLLKYGDPYCHHGEAVMFYEVTQHTEVQAPKNRPQGEKFGHRASANTAIKEKLPVTAMMHVVPTLVPELDAKVEVAQRQLVEGLSEESRERYFPRHGNPKRGGVVGIGNHSMSHYTTHLRDNFLEALNSLREPPLEVQATRKEFMEQMGRYNSMEVLIEDEVDRNQFFMDLHNKVKDTVEVTWREDGGPEGLTRFDQLASQQAVYKTCWENTLFSKKEVACPSEKN
ncbi:lipase family protein [Pseudomonas sp. NPDC090202]|uniref:lipase family protein n=1 Tax=unclassified Pseudomonas TaxID=196821 RepID=UPI00381B54CC